MPALQQANPYTRKGRVMVIWKYPIQLADAFMLEVPADARPLSVIAQKGKPMIYFLIKDAETMARSRWYISVVGTGSPITSLAGDETFIGTFQLYDGDYVFHVFAALNGTTAPA